LGGVRREVPHTIEYVSIAAKEKGINIVIIILYYCTMPWQGANMKQKCIMQIVCYWKYYFLMGMYFLITLDF